MRRRTMLWRCLGFLGLSGVFGSLARAGPHYRRPRERIFLPLDKVTELWRPLPFDALFSVPQPAGPASEVLLKGVLVRVPSAGRPGTELKAFCLQCPHELCFVNFADSRQLAFVAPDVKSEHPLAVCPCHFSVFDPVADGAHLTGPSPRGLYRFQLEVGETHVEVTGVENAVFA